MKDIPHKLLAFIVLILIAGLFALDLLTPVRLAVWLPYIAIVMLSLRLPRRWEALATACLCSVLIVLGLIFSPPGSNPEFAAINRFIGIVSLWMALGIGIAVQRVAVLQKLNKRLEEEIVERQRAEEKLREQASLLDLSPDAIMVRDLEQRIVFWSRGSERMYGWTAREALGSNGIALLAREDSQVLATAQDQLRKNGNWVGELRQMTKDQRSIVVESRWTLVRDANGQHQSILVVNTDITEKRHLESQLRHSQRLESIGVLAGGIAHDFNNLLTPILMSVKLLREDRPEPDRQNLLAILQASAMRGTEMVRQLLAFAGGSEGERANVALTRIIQEIKSILDHTFPKSIQITANCPDGMILLADATQISQVLMNLCVNARDAMPAGGSLSITAERIEVDDATARSHSDARPGPYVCICVADTGRGISIAVIDHIFDPFFTTKEPGHGTGLGLSTALGIVKGHGGFITFNTEIGRGSEFLVYLPYQCESLASAPPMPDSPVARGHGELILLVDDEFSIRVTVKATLEDHGYRVVTAANGQEALTAYAQHRDDIRAVLLDMMMPVMDGPTTVKSLEEIDPQVRIITMSGLRMTERLPEARAGCDRPFLQKPYSDRQVLDLLSKMLRP